MSYHRFKAHLLEIKWVGVSSCTKVTNKTVVEMLKVIEEVEQMVKQYNPKQVPLPTSSVEASNFGNSSTSDTTIGVRYHGLPTPSVDLKRMKGAIGLIEKTFNVGAHETTDSEIVRMFYTGGCPFTLVEILIMFVHLKVQVNYQVISHQAIMH